MTRVFMLRSDAPTKPAAGQPCNGCGVCCAAEPCPVGMLVSRRRTGRCRALVWQQGRYRCGMVSHTARHLPPAAALAGTGGPAHGPALDCRRQRLRQPGRSAAHRPRLKPPR
ncbi:hypothetical protein [Aquincola sp. J276]|uniref:hypothetical protein n=1 Tax=Aquincola sp. J276 TaxID=2898432 RepID=UPI002873407D|nr:hypothetical protein [Aquincola sp. J276]